MPIRIQPGSLQNTNSISSALRSNVKSAPTRAFLVLPALVLLTIMLGTGCSNDPDRVLVFSHTESFRHQHIPTGKGVLQTLGAELGIEVDTTENPLDFNDENLANYDAVVFLSTTGNVLPYDQQVAFQRYIQSGGAYMGIHAASDTEYNWPWYGQLVGGYFTDHPAPQEATLDVLTTEHPVTSHLPERWTRFDEWYNIRFVNPDITPLISIDETTYDPGNDISEGDSHPLVWYHHFDGGRSLYIQPGHVMEAWTEPAYLDLLSAGMAWVVSTDGRPDMQKEPTPDERDFEIEVLTSNLNEPMELAPLPDGRVLFIERSGTVHLVDPASGSDEIINEMEVAYGLEDGLIGLTIDPAFEDNGWVYLYYSPVDAIANRLSRYTFDGEGIDPTSEMVLLDVTTQRDTCCHAGGSLTFGPEGNLFLSTGDNVNPFEADSFAPIDERPGRAPFDAQGTSANSQDLRGKILRIRPEADGTYSIPDGNLFEDPAEGRPEIYTMGHRNPFRISVDSKTGNLYWGDIGPDASAPSDIRGPRGYDEVNQARSAGNFGWPYFLADNRAYADWDFAAESSKGWFDPAAPINDSPNNTGAVVLPPAQPAFIWYPYAHSTEFPLMDREGFETASRSAMAGPVFHESDISSPSFPAYFEDKLFLHEWERRKLLVVTMNENGDYRYMEEFLPSHTWVRPMDMAFGQDGALYVLEYGEAWNTRNEDATLTRITYKQ